MELPVGSGLSRNEAGGLSFGGKQTLSSGILSRRKGDEAAGVGFFTRRKGDKFSILAEFLIYTLYPENFSGKFILTI